MTSTTPDTRGLGDLDWAIDCETTDCASDHQQAASFVAFGLCGCSQLICQPCADTIRRWQLAWGLREATVRCSHCGSVLTCTAADYITVTPL